MSIPPQPRQTAAPHTKAPVHERVSSIRVCPVARGSRMTSGLVTDETVKAGSGWKAGALRTAATVRFGGFTERSSLIDNGCGRLTAQAPASRAFPRQRRRIRYQDYPDTRLKTGKLITFVNRVERFISQESRKAQGEQRVSRGVGAVARASRGVPAGSDHATPLFCFAMAFGSNRNGALDRQFLASDRCAKLYTERT